MDKLEPYGKLAAAINQAKEKGDVELLREIAEDPQGFILRQGWSGLDFSDEVELSQLRRLLPPHSLNPQLSTVDHLYHFAQTLSSRSRSPFGFTSFSISRISSLAAP